MRIEISDGTFRRLQKHAEPLVDSVEDVILKLLDIFEAKKEAGGEPDLPLLGAGSVGVNGPKAQDAPPREELSGFRKELWEMVVKKLPERFSLHDVYKHQEPLEEQRPHVKEMEATIRNAMQRLRDMGYVEFLRRGEYRRLD